MRAFLITVQAGILIILVFFSAIDGGERSAQSPVKPPATTDNISL